MNQILRHIPGAAFDSRDTPEQPVDFETVDQLMAIPFVKHWAESRGHVRFSVSSPSGNWETGRALLMSEQSDGTWWVVGHLLSPVDGLPAWRAPK